LSIRNIIAIIQGMFEIKSKLEKRRIGILKTKNGDINTPFFMPIATKGAVKNILPEEIKKIGAEIVLGNTYHLWLRPGDETIKKAGGLHKFMDWDGPILTDSGGFQVFSLGARAKEKFGKSGVRLSEKGVYFSDPENGKKYFMSPEKSIEIQLNLGSDIIMVLDECPPFPCDYQYAKKSLELTARWAKRCLEYFQEKTGNMKKKPLLFAIVQGSVYEDLRKESARQLVAMNFDGYAIGGVAVGEPREKMYEILNWVLPILPEDKPRYLMGLGRPEEIVAAVGAGVDMFDCVIPTREGRHGRLFIRKNESKNQSADWRTKIKIKKELFYETININNEKYKEDFSPVDEYCDCALCKNYTKSYLRHLFAVSEPLALRLASIHNLKFYTEMMKKLQEE